MFNPNFDPLQDLRQCQIDSKQDLHNSIELAKAHNAQEGLMAELTNQHNQVIGLIRNMRREIEQLKRIQNATLESQRNCTCQTTNTDSTGQ